MCESILARSPRWALPSRSTRSAVPVGKKGRMSVNDAMNIFGRE